jgi:hypothetical protein
MPGRFFQIVILLSLILSCEKNLGIEEKQFACVNSDDCLEGFICVNLVCVNENAVPDIVQNDTKQDAELENQCTVYYLDGDGDGFGIADDSSCMGSPSGKYTALKDGDCNDQDKSIFPELYSEKADSGYDVGMYSSMKVMDGTVHIAYYDKYNKSLKFAVKPLDPSVKDWDISEVDKDDTGEKCSLAVNPLKTGTAMAISYYDGKNMKLKLASRVSAKDSWTLKTIDTQQESGFYSSAAISKNGIITVAYFNSSNEFLKLYRSDAPGSLKAVGQKKGWYLSLALGSDETAYMAYFDYSNKKLGFTKCLKTGECASENPDSTQNAGKYASIAADTKNNVHISYYSEDAQILKYITNAGGKWISSAVDSDGDVGLYTSLYLAEDGIPFISYRDSEKQGLKFAFMESGKWASIMVDGNVRNVGE